MKNRKTRILIRLILAFVILTSLACLSITFFYIPARATWVYGSPSTSLSIPQRIQYSALLLWYDGMLTNPLDRNGQEQPFTVEQGEAVDSIASRLEVVGLIREAGAFRSYLIYS